jgi:TorA maturation chaperone TorD
MHQAIPDVHSGRVIDSIDHARAREYALLATLLSKGPEAGLIRRLASLSGDESRLGKAHVALSDAASCTTEADAAREYFELFVGVGRGLLLPYSSHYLAGSLYGRPLARIRQTLQQLGIEWTRAREPEDHIAVLFEAMAGLVGGDLAGSFGADRVFFKQHLAPWAARFCLDLERTKSANFYARVGSLGRIFMEIETEADSLSTQAQAAKGSQKMGEA